MDQFLDIFGQVTVSDLTGWTIAIIFIVKTYRKVRDYLIARHEAEEQKDKDLKEALMVTRQYPEYRAQSLKIQQSLENKISNLTDRIESIEKSNRKREQNRLRECLLRSYRYYTDPEKNPQQAWTRLESQTFWSSFGDYEELDGDGFVHTVIQPAMNKLQIIEMTDDDTIEELMKSRR